jgi:NAD(P)-dependent dehydrogenase (short-subunit alcohol dehydrogenase family)
MGAGTTLENRTALITGASRGIGRAIARRLAAEGVSVVLSASRRGRHGELEGTLDEAVAAINAAGGRAEGVAANLLSDDERGDLVARAEACFGPLDILINNAAMGRWGLPSQAPLKDRRKMMEVNVHAPVDLAQQAVPGMRERGGGWILSISSDTARQFDVPYRDTPEAAHVVAPYGASKAALNRYMEGLAHELSSDSIFVNTLAPVAIVLTQETARFVGHIARANPDMVEPVETMAEAALELVSGRHVGQVAYSRKLLHSVGRQVRSLDGKDVLGDAFIAADLETIVG